MVLSTCRERSLGQAQAYLACVIPRCISALQPVTVHLWWGRRALWSRPRRRALPPLSHSVAMLECKDEDNNLQKGRRVTSFSRSYIK